MDDLVALEERLAHLTRAVEEMSDEMARQGREIDVLTRRVALLLQREAEGDGAGRGGGDSLGRSETAALVGSSAAPACNRGNKIPGRRSAAQGFAEGPLLRCNRRADSRSGRHGTAR